MATTLDLVSVKDFGALGLGNNASELVDAVSINKALISVKKSGKTLYFPAGTYMINNTIGAGLYADDKDISIVCDPSTIIKASNLPANIQLIHFLGKAGVHSFSWKGGTIDGRLMPAKNPDKLAPNCMSVNGGFGYIKKMHFSNLKIIANNTRAGTASDTCLGIAGDDISIVNCIFQGAVDAGVYLSANVFNDTVVYGERFYMSGCTFIECKDGFISKRMYKNHIINGNFFQNCQNACVVGAAAGQGPTNPKLLRGGRVAVISSNTIENCGIGIELRDSNNSIITGNRADGCTSFSYRVYGCEYCIISSNWSSSSGIGIKLQNLAANSNLPAVVTKNTLITSNSLNNHSTGILEDPGVVYSTMVGNTFNAVATKYQSFGTNSNYGQKIKLVPLTADPAIKVAGDIYLNSNTKKLRYYTGSAWLDL